MTGRPSSRTPEQAEQEARALGYEPLEPYPGGTHRRWLLRCTTCGKTRPIRFDNILNGQVCKHSRGFLTPEEAEAELRAAGYEPLEPYPGRVSRAWEARCTTCQQVRHPTLNRVREGRVCKHRPISGKPHPHRK